jgi:glycerol-3-phosphate dehydrogenase
MESYMARQTMIDALGDEKDLWDVAVIGGGATGLGVAIDAVTRGYKTILLEQSDFSKGTSSRSTKLVHGGVRYLKQGNLSLVLEALHERGIMMQNAPHLVSNQAFIVPNYDWWEGPFYGIGMKVYDMLAGKLGLRPSRNLSVREVLKRIPTLEPKGLKGGVIYYDGQFDDSRLAVNMAQTIAEHGGVCLNYMEVVSLLKTKRVVGGVTAKDVERGKIYEIPAKIDEVSLEPRALEEEIDFILTHACRYLSQDPQRSDVQSVFAGIRPLIKMGDGKSTAELSRDHNLFISQSGLVTITGGKWTTYRKMAEDTINQAAVVAGLERRPCITENMRIHGWLKNINPADPLGHYGSDLLHIRRLITEEPTLGERLHKELPYLKAEVIWGVRHEMARTVEDVLARRTRALLLNAKASMEMASTVAEMMADEMKKNKAWQKKQVTDYRKLAEGYLPKMEG